VDASKVSVVRNFPPTFETPTRCPDGSFFSLVTSSPED
jgi:hypothetical protein